MNQNSTVCGQCGNDEYLDVVQGLDNHLWILCMSCKRNCGIVPLKCICSQAGNFELLSPVKMRYVCKCRKNGTVCVISDSELVGYGLYRQHSNVVNLY